MSDSNWPIVGLAFVQMLQVVALAYINSRGIVLPPTNRRSDAKTPATPQDSAVKRRNRGSARPRA